MIFDTRLVALSGSVQATAKELPDQDTWEPPPWMTKAPLAETCSFPLMRLPSVPTRRKCVVAFDSVHDTPNWDPANVKALSTPLPTITSLPTRARGFGLQVPALPDRLQASQVPLHAPLQQTPSTQKPLVHSLAPPQAVPGDFFGVQAPPAAQ